MAVFNSEEAADFSLGQEILSSLGSKRYVKCLLLQVGGLRNVPSEATCAHVSPGSPHTRGTCPRSGGAGGSPTDARPLVGGRPPCSETPAPAGKEEKNANSS